MSVLRQTVLHIRGTLLAVTAIRAVAVLVLVILLMTAGRTGQAANGTCGCACVDDVEKTAIGTMAADGPCISAWTRSANADETFLLIGDHLDKGTLMLSDGTETFAVSAIDNGTSVFRNDTRMMAVVPEHARRGTLWLWFEEDGARISNMVTVNAPEPWWVQPDQIDIGETTRVFGRNLDANRGPQATSVRVKLVGASGTFFCDANVVKPNAIELTSDPVTGLRYGEYELYVEESKTGDFYGPLMLTVRRAYQRPEYTVDVTSVGAIPDDAKPDNQAFLTAIDRVVTNGGGTVVVPAGTFLFDESVIGDPSAGTVLPGNSARYRDGNVHIAGQGVDETVLEFAFSQRQAKNFNRITLYSNSSLRDMTIRVRGDQYLRADYVLAMKGTNAQVDNVVIDLDECEIFQNPITAEGQYLTIDGVEIRGGGAIEFRGRQIQIQRVTHRGPMPQGHYPQEDQDNLNFAPDLFYTVGVRELILEENWAGDRWDEYPGAHFKRFLGGATHWGGVYHAYVADNTVVDMKTQPFNNSGECILFEGTVEFYRGTIECDGADPRRISLLDSSIADDAKVFGDYAQPQNTPLLVTVVNGTGAGQTQEGYAIDGTTIVLDEALAVCPDETSMVLVQWGFSQNLLCNNKLQGGSPYAVASMGILLYGTATNNIIRDNRLEGFHLGYSDTVFGSVSDDKYWDGTLPLYFNEVRDNEIVETLGGIVTNVTEGERHGIHAIGNLYRGNVIRDMNRRLPQFKYRGPYSALGIVPWSVRHQDEVSPGSGAVVGQIYESNSACCVRNGFVLNQPFADWTVLRGNTLGHGITSGLDIDPTVVCFADRNEINALPEIRIVTATVPYRGQFKLPWVTWTEGEIDQDYYLWSRTGQGSMTVRVEDSDEDLLSGIELHSGPGIRLAENQVMWEDLDIGLHIITLTAADGKGVGERRICLFVGGYDDFEAVTSIVRNGMTGRNESYHIVTVSGAYTTTVTQLFNEQDSSVAHYHRVDDPDDATYTQRLRIRPVNEEVSLRPDAVRALSPNAILSFVKNHHHGAESYVKMRLKRDETNYYEFYDHIDVPRRFQLRRVSKIVNGAEVKTVHAFAAHNWESPVIFQKSGTTIRVSGWGDTIELDDPQPLDVGTWEIIVASPAVGTDSFLEEYAYATIDNLYFATGEDLAMDW